MPLKDEQPYPSIYVQDSQIYSPLSTRSRSALSNIIVAALFILTAFNGSQLVRNYSYGAQTTPALSSAGHFRQAWTGMNRRLPPRALMANQRYAKIDSHSVCIIAADDRPFHAFEKPRVYWNDTEADVPKRLQDVDYPDASTLYNFFWSLRHGYRYLRIETQDRPNRFRTWGKVSAILEALSQYNDCEYFVFTDPDVYVTDPSFSLETMMEYWGVHDKVTLVITAEVPKYPEHAELGYTTTNTGFFILRNNNLAKDIFTRLDTCPTEVPGCDTYLQTYWHEQSAFNRFILPSLSEGEDVVILPAGDAGGWWASGQEGCEGKLVSHVWDGKQYVGPRTREIMMSEMYQLLSDMYQDRSV